MLDDFLAQHEVLVDNAEIDKMKPRRVLMEGKVRLKRVKSKKRKKRTSNVRDRIHKAGGVMFDEIIAILSKGHTNVTFLDLNGDPVFVMADAVGLAPTRKRRKTEKFTRLERSIQKALELNDVEVDINPKQALAMLERPYGTQENLLKKYKVARA